MSKSFSASWLVQGDYGQNRRLDELGEEIALAQYKAHAQHRRLHSELRHVRGSLEQRLNRLTASFDAFVELGDLRALLLPFAPYARVRYQVHRLLQEGASARLDLDEAPSDYWLVPSAKGLHAALNGSAASALRHFAAAARLDPVRTGVFALLATATAGGSPDPERTAPLVGHFLPDLLSDLSFEVRRHERALWLAAAGKLLGAEGRELVRRLLAAVLEQSSEAERSAPVMPPLPPHPARVRSDVVNVGAVSLRLDAAHRLSALRSALEQPPRQEAPEIDPRVTETLRLLVDEGVADEAPLVRRAEQLRRVVESSGEHSPDTEPPLWNETAGDLRELLAADVAATEERTAPGRFALGLFAPQILTAAEDLADSARKPLADETFLSYRGARVVLASYLADEGSLAMAEQRIRRLFMEHQSMAVVWWSLGVAAGAVLLAVVTQWFAPLLTVAVIAGVVGGWKYIDVQTERRRQEADAEADIRTLHRRVKQGEREWGDLYDRAARAAEGAEHDLAAVREVLERL